MESKLLHSSTHLRALCSRMCLPSLFPMSVPRLYPSLQSKIRGKWSSEPPTLESRNIQLEKKFSFNIKHRPFNNSAELLNNKTRNAIFQDQSTSLRGDCINGHVPSIDVELLWAVHPFMENKPKCRLL